MKEASGEANLTVITIILIGVIVAIVTPIVTNMMKDTEAKSECMSDGYTTKAELEKCIKATRPSTAQ